MRLNGTQPQELRELFDVTERPLSIIFERTWSSEKISEDWKKADMTPIFSKGKEETLGSYRPAR